MKAQSGQDDSPFVMRTHIVKNDWLAAGQCQTMAWHGLRADPEEADEATLFRMMQGREVGELARRRFPEGVLVLRTPTISAVEVTRLLMSDSSTDTLFEAAFNAGPFAAKADILRREAGEWHVLEVKSSFSDTSELSKHVDDLAYTVMVLKRNGLAVAKASLVLLSRDYRRGQDVDALFDILDVTPEVRERAAAFDQAADNIASALLAERRPDAVLVTACRRCEYFAEKCLGSGHKHTVIELPNLHHTKFRKLAATGVVSIEDVPPDIALTERQQRVQEAAASGEVFVDSNGLRTALNSIRWPCHYLDFETVATVMPL